MKKKNDEEIFYNALFWACLKFEERATHFLKKMQEENVDRKDCIESIINFCKMYDETKELIEREKNKRSKTK